MNLKQGKSVISLQSNIPKRIYRKMGKVTIILNACWDMIKEMFSKQLITTPQVQVQKPETIQT